MPIAASIIDLYLSLDRYLIPEQNQSAIKGHRKGRTYTREQLIKFTKKGCNLGWILSDRDVVIDVDPRNGGDRSLEKICKKLGLDDLSVIYPTVLTGGGGMHYYTTLPRKYDPRQLRASIKKLPGIELLHKGMKVTLPGSIHHKTGRKYKIDSQSPFKVKPKPIKEKLLRAYFKNNDKAPAKSEKPKPLKPITTKKLYQLLKCLPIDDYSIHEDWFNIMVAAHSATAGKGLKAFLKWSLKDNRYIDDADQIKTRWQSLKANQGITALTLMKEVRKYDKQIKLDDSKPADLEQELVQNLLDREFASGSHLLHCADQRYWKYNGTHWVLLLPNIVSQYLLKEIETYKEAHPDFKKNAASLLVNCERILKATVAADRNINSGLTRTQSIVNTKNYEIWINETTGRIELKDHDPKSFLTYCLNVEYDPLADCPRYDQALEEIFDSDRDYRDLIRHYWEINGYAIQNKKNIPIWIMYQGSGANGKKVLTQVPLALLGDAVCYKAIDDLDTKRNNHALEDLPGKLVVFDDDVDSNAVLPDGMLKKISENKTLQANPKGSPTFKFENTAIVMMAANNWPRTRDISLGMRRRAMVFHLKRTFEDSEQDLDLVDYIVENELAGVLNRCLKGFKRLRKRGNFQVPKSCLAAAQLWFSSSSQVHQFIEDNLRKKKRARTTFNNVWDRYRSWAFENGIGRPYTRNYFKRLLLDLKYDVRRSTGNKLWLRNYKLIDREI